MRVRLIVAYACLYGATAAVAADNQLTIVNKCTVPVWIQQDGMPALKPVVEIAPDQSHAYPIVAKGLPSTRYWPKFGCDKDGNNCAIG